MISTSPHSPLPGIHASMSTLRYALAPSSSLGISSNLKAEVERRVSLWTTAQGKGGNLTELSNPNPR